MSKEPQDIGELNIYQKLSIIRKPVEVLRNNKEGYGYKYVTDDEILAKITGLMRKNEVSLVPIIMPGTMQVVPYHYKKTKVMKNGQIYEENVNEILISADMEWHWVNDRNPAERIVVPWATVGQQGDASQAFGSGLTYSMRYFLLKYFNVSTSDADPDQWRSKQKEAERLEEMQIIESLTNEIDTLIRTYKTDNNKKAIIEIVKKHVKDKSGKPSANYFEINDSVVAATVLADLKKYISCNPTGS